MATHKSIVTKEIIQKFKGYQAIPWLKIFSDSLMLLEDNSNLCCISQLLATMILYSKLTSKSEAYNNSPLFSFL